MSKNKRSQTSDDDLFGEMVAPPVPASRSRLGWIILGTLFFLILATGTVYSVLEWSFLHRLHKQGAGFRPVLPPLGSRNDIEMVWFGESANDADFPAVVESLKTLKGLKSLRLNYSPLTGAVICDIAQLPQLKALSMEGTDTTDAHLRCLCSTEHISGLNLAATKITDASFNCLTKMKGLKYLNLSKTYVTPEGLLKLSELPKLELLTISEIPLTESQLRKLEEALPRVKIVR